MWWSIITLPIALLLLLLFTWWCSYGQIRSTYRQKSDIDFLASVNKILHTYVRLIIPE